MSIVVSVFKLLPLLFTPCLTHGIPCALKLLWSIIVLSVCHNGCVQSRAARWNHSTVSSHNSAGESSHPQLEPEGEGTEIAPVPLHQELKRVLFLATKKSLYRALHFPLQQFVRFLLRSHWCFSHSSQFGDISRRGEGTLPHHLINGDVKQDCTVLSLGYTASAWPPANPKSITFRKIWDPL